LGMFLNAADSQIVYVFLSGGFIGFVLYFIALLRFFLLGKSRLHYRLCTLEPIFVALFWSFMVFSVTHEVFNLSKTGGLFSATMGILLGIASGSPLARASVYYPNQGTKASA